MPKKGEYFKFKNHKRKMKLLFIISADFKSNLVPEDNRNQNLEEFYTKNYQKHVGSSYGNTLVCVDGLDLGNT